MLGDLGNKSDSILCFGGGGMSDSHLQQTSLSNVHCALSNADP